MKCRQGGHIFIPTCRERTLQMESRPLSQKCLVSSQLFPRSLHVIQIYSSRLNTQKKNNHIKIMFFLHIFYYSKETHITNRKMNVWHAKVNKPQNTRMLKWVHHQWTAGTLLVEKEPHKFAAVRRTFFFSTLANNLDIIQCTQQMLPTSFT